MPYLGCGKDGSWMDWPVLRSKSSVWARTLYPSSPPDAMNGSFLFQSITLTSLSWAFSVVIIQDLLGSARMSQIRIVLSTEQEAITLASFGDH